MTKMSVIIKKNIKTTYYNNDNNDNNDRNAYKTYIIKAIMTIMTDTFIQRIC